MHIYYQVSKVYQVPDTYVKLAQDLVQSISLLLKAHLVSPMPPEVYGKLSRAFIVSQHFEFGRSPIQTKPWEILVFPPKSAGTFASTATRRLIHRVGKSSKNSS